MLSRTALATWITLLLAQAVAPPATANTSATTRWWVTPHFGLAAAHNSGVTFGLSSAYTVSERLSFGPFGEFATASRQWEIGTPLDRRKTQATTTWIAGARLTYRMRQHTDSPWHLHTGAAFVRFGAIDGFRNGARFDFDPYIPGPGSLPGEIAAAHTVAATAGGGTLLPMNERTAIALNLNLYATRLGEAQGRTLRGQDIDLGNAIDDGGLMWLTTITMGFQFAR